MIIRVVKMTFRENEVENFLKIFNSSKHKIQNFEGCTHLELWRDKNSPSIFFTYSHWQNELFLEKYRQSDLFKNVWNQTKILFADSPQAWSVERQ
jgi:quinol monooxygenase YgiN